MIKDLETKFENQQNLSKVLASGSDEEVNDALVAFAQGIQEKILAQASVQSSDQAILAA
ncbi:phage major capsid protein, partial [Bacillus thuringiensis]